MFKKIVRRLKGTFHNAPIKKFQEEIDFVKNIENKEATEKLCAILRKYSKYSKLKFVEALDLRNCCLENSNLENTCLKRLCFWNTNLQKSSLKGACLYEADLWKANLSNSNLSNADLTNSILTQANLQNSILTGTNFKNAMLNEANLYNADLTGSNLKWAKIDLFQLKTVKSLKGAVMPDGTKFSMHWAEIIENKETPEEYSELWHQLN